MYDDDKDYENDDGHADDDELVEVWLSQKRGSESNCALYSMIVSGGIWRESMGQGGKILLLYFHRAALKSEKYVQHDFLAVAIYLCASCRF